MFKHKVFLSLFLMFSLLIFKTPGPVSAFDKTHLEKLRSTKECMNCNLSEADLAGVDLRGANLTWASLEGTRNLDSVIGKPYQNRIIELLYKQEVMYARLYNKFADKFLEYTNFWGELAQDELRHTELVKRVYQYEKKELVAFSEGKVKAPALVEATIEVTEKPYSA